MLIKQVNRPWGYYIVLYDHPNFKIKEVCVYPRRRLSLQKHKYRYEHWLVIYGTGKAIIGDKTVRLLPHKSIDVPSETIHRLINDDYHGKLIIIEIQTGNKLDEKDIIRLEDDYGRGTARSIAWEDE